MPETVRLVRTGRKLIRAGTIKNPDGDGKRSCNRSKKRASSRHAVLSPQSWGGPLSLLQNVSNALHADDVLAVHIHDGVVSDGVSYWSRFVSQQLLVLRDTLRLQGL